jgi:hypothetical protein
MLAGILEIFLGFWASQQRLPVQGAIAFQLHSNKRP